MLTLNAFKQEVLAYLARTVQFARVSISRSFQGGDIFNPSTVGMGGNEFTTNIWLYNHIHLAQNNLNND